MVDLDVARSGLEAERAELRAQLEALTAAPRDPMEAVSFGKRIGDGTTQAVERIAQVSAAEAFETKLADVDRALEKLDEGTYGVCDVCGRPIGEDRLEAIPSAVRCVEDAARR